MSLCQGVGALCCNLTAAQLLDHSDLDKCYTGAAAMSAHDVDILYQLSLGLDTDKQLNIYLDCEFFALGEMMQISMLFTSSIKI